MTNSNWQVIRFHTFFVVAISTPGIWCILFGSSTSVCTRAAISAASRSLCMRSICRACDSFISLKYFRKSCVALVIVAHIAFKRSYGTHPSVITKRRTKDENRLILFVWIYQWEIAFSAMTYSVTMNQYNRQLCRCHRSSIAMYFLLWWQYLDHAEQWYSPLRRCLSCVCFGDRWSTLRQFDFVAFVCTAWTVLPVPMQLQCEHWILKNCNEFIAKWNWKVNSYRRWWIMHLHAYTLVQVRVWRTFEHLSGNNMEEHVCNIERRHRAAGQRACCLPTVRHMFVPLSLNCHEMKFHDNRECMRANVRVHLYVWTYVCLQAQSHWIVKTKIKWKNSNSILEQNRTLFSALQIMNWS